MKRIITSLLMVFVFMSFSPETKTISHNITYITNCKFGQCQATAKSTGKQCKHCVSKSGDKFCFQHK
jgi:hypothetical protein